MPEPMTGGCACGRIRYSVAIADDKAYLCHCRMCQRATGGVSILTLRPGKTPRWPSVTIFSPALSPFSTMTRLPCRCPSVPVR